jgi:integrase
VGTLLHRLRDDYVLNNRVVRRLDCSAAHLAPFFHFTIVRDVNGKIVGYKGGIKAKAVDADLIDAYVAKRLREAGDTAKATVCNELGDLHRSFTLAVAKNTINAACVPHMPLTRPENARQGFFEDSQRAGVVGELRVPHVEDWRGSRVHPVVADIVEFYAETGWRKEEPLKLLWSMIDREDKIITLPGYYCGRRQTKNGKPRIIKYGSSPILVRLFDRRWKDTQVVQRETGTIVPWVFHRDGKQVKNIDDAFRRACERAGVEGLTRHDFRRTAARNFDKAGVRRQVGMVILGQLTEAMYDRYNITNAQDTDEAFAQLEHLRQREQGRVAGRIWTSETTLNGLSRSFGPGAGCRALFSSLFQLFLWKTASWITNWITNCTHQIGHFPLQRVAGACGNRTHQGARSEPQLVLRTSQTTRPDPPPRHLLGAETPMYYNCTTSQAGEHP